MQIERKKQDLVLQIKYKDSQETDCLKKCKILLQKATIFRRVKCNLPVLVVIFYILWMSWTMISWHCVTQRHKLFYVVNSNCFNGFGLGNKRQRTRCWFEILSLIYDFFFEIPFLSRTVWLLCVNIAINTFDLLYSRVKVMCLFDPPTQIGLRCTQFKTVCVRRQRAGQSFPFRCPEFWNKLLLVVSFNVKQCCCT